MAETSVLTSAHQHARDAAEEYQKIHFTDAAEQHRLASMDFARASKATSDSEALRVLKLLEEQHRRLARIVRSQNVHKIQDDSKVSSQGGATAIDKPAPTIQTTTSSPTAAANNREAKASAPIVASARINSHVRDSSLSLARDIATRRGIPQPARTQLSPAAQARARQQSPESRRRSAPAPIVPPSIVDSQADLQLSKTAKKAEDEEGFTKFYNNLTTGTMSKLSSVLAYAGLPLSAEESTKSDQQKPSKRTVPANNDPDVKKIFSKAALEAIEEEHRRRGTLGHGFGPAESFYVVQKGGGTYSYADIARAQKQQWGEDEEDVEFVDAPEKTPAAQLHKGVRRAKAHRVSFGSPSTYEELELENTTLKSTIEDFASRLSAFEAHAQDASMAALTQSMLSVKAPTTGPAATDAKVLEENRQLKLQLEEAKDREQKTMAVSEKQVKELKKYRHKFDELKKAAREKEKRKEEGKSAGGGDVV